MRLGLILFLALLMGAQGATPIFINRGAMLTPTNIDARVFINEGLMEFSVPGGVNPYETLNTIIFSNAPNGIINVNPGFDFSYSTFVNPRTGKVLRVAPRNKKKQQFIARKQGSIFDNQGLVEANDFRVIGGGVTMIPRPAGSWIYVNSSNVINGGVLSAGASGLIKIDGRDVNLALGGLRTGEPLGDSFGGTFISSNTNEFFPDRNIFDIYWGSGTNQVLGGDGSPLFLPSRQFDEPDTSTPLHQVLTGGNFTNVVSLPRLSFEGFKAFAFTNRNSATSEVIQVVFVATNSMDENLVSDVRFSSGPTGQGHTAIVKFEVEGVDPVFDQPYTNRVFIFDHLAWTNSARLQFNVEAGTRKPANYEITRSDAFEFEFGQESNREFTFDLIYNPGYSNAVVTNVYSAYSATIGSQESAFNFDQAPTQNSIRLAALNDPTNRPGRIEVTATNLDLSQLRLRAEGYVSIKGHHVTGSPQVLDASLLAFDLGSTNGQMVITNIAPLTVTRLSGEIACYSAVWMNTRTEVIGGGTNQIAMKFHVLVVDRDFVTDVPVNVRDLLLRSENITLQDSLTVLRKTRIEAANMTIEGGLTLATNADASIFPGLLNFTNLGFFSFNGVGEFGKAPAEPLVSFVNQGSIDGQSLYVASSYIENSSFITTTLGPIVFDGDLLNLSNSVLAADGNISLFGREITSPNSTLTAGGAQTNFQTGQVLITPGRLIVRATDLLTDFGPDAGIGRWTVLNGFELQTKPAFGDLLATRLTTLIPRFRSATHTWAGQDRGSDPVGYVDNAAVGHLIIDIERAGSRATFSGVNGANGLYVDYLELRNYATNYLDTSILQINPNLTIYFADANLPPEKLDGRPDGRLRWVPSYAGANSSTNITYPNGQTYTFNTALVRSSDLDSDGDGTANSQDPTPIPVEE